MCVIKQSCFHTVLDYHSGIPPILSTHTHTPPPHTPHTFHTHTHMHTPTHTHAHTRTHTHTHAHTHTPHTFHTLTHTHTHTNTHTHTHTHTHTNTHHLLKTMRVAFEVTAPFLLLTVHMYNPSSFVCTSLILSTHTSSPILENARSMLKGWLSWDHSTLGAGLMLGLIRHLN